MTVQSRPSVAIVGAGIAGLACGRLLAAQSRAVTLFDKGRAPGGRLATRRRDALHFDHGAQFFTAREAGFREEVEAWVEAGIAATWRGRFARIGADGPGEEALGEDRFVGLPGMSALGRHLAHGLRVESGLRIASLERRAGLWKLTDEHGEGHGDYDQVIVATPADQATPLLQASDALSGAAAAAGYAPCWAVLLGFDAPLPVAWDGAEIEGSAIAWAARNNAKPGRPAAEAWTLHCGPDWSRDHLEEEAEEVAAAVTDAFAQLLGDAIPRPAFVQAHRWRYARVERAVGTPCLYDSELALGACGDWCLEGRVEAAWVSGAAMARRLLSETTDSRPGHTQN